MTDLWVDGGDHGQGYLEHSLVPVDPLEVGEWSVRRDLAVRWGRMVGSDAEVKVTELYLPVLKHWNPLRERERRRERQRRRERVGERETEKEREGGGGKERWEGEEFFFAVNRPSSHRQSCIYTAESSQCSPRRQVPG